MPKRLRVPALVHHKPTGQAAVFLRGADGARRAVYLGKHGTAEAERRYHELVAQVLAGAPVDPRPQPLLRDGREWPSVAKLAADYLLHARRYYVDESGEQTGEVERSTYSIAPLLRLYRDTPTDRFGVAELKKVRQSMIDDRIVRERGRRAPKGLCRRTINDRVKTIRRLFRWGVEEGLVPGLVLHELRALESLKAKRSGVHDNPAVEQVPQALVDSTLPHLSPTVRAAVLVQMLGGMRPGEVLSMTRRQIDATVLQWLYRPTKHKGSWRSRERVIALGPRAQDVLRPFLGLDLDAPIFNPRDSWEQFRDEKRRRVAACPVASR